MQNKNLIFDLDATLYYVGDEIEKLCDAKVVEYFVKNLGLNFSQAKDLIKDIRSRYAYDVEALEGELPFSKAEFIDYVCDVDVSVLKADSELDNLLKALPQSKYILTDSIKKHVDDTLRALSVDAGRFNGIFDAHDMAYAFKYNPQSYSLFLRKYNLDAKDCIMFEDSLVNLKTAKSLGFSTVLIRPELKSAAYVDYCFGDIKTALKALFF